MFLGFVAGGAVLGFVVVHGDFEHVVAADTDAVNLGGGLRVRLGWAGMRGGLRLVCLNHGSILT